MTSRLLIALLPAPAALVVGYLIGAAGRAPAPGAERAALAAVAPTPRDEGTPAPLAAAPPREAGPAPERREARPSAPASTVAAPGADERTRGLLGELDLLLASGRLQESLAEDPDGLRRFLLDKYLAFGDHDAAWRLLEESGGSAVEWRRVGRALHEAGDDERAVGAVDRAIDRVLAEADPAAPSWTLRNSLRECLWELVGMDPAAALATLDRLDLAVDDGVLPDRFERARFLIQVGRPGEAFGLWNEGLEDPLDRANALSQILGTDPVQAETYLRERLAAVGGDPQLEAALASTLAQQGRHEEALDLIDGVLASGDRTALEQVERLLHELPAELVVDRLDAWLAATDDESLGGARVDLLSGAMDTYVEAGRTEEAFELQLRVLAAIAAGEASPDWMPQLPSEVSAQHAARLAPALRAAEERAGGNDELWGDLADLYWDAGLREDARRCWQRAWDLDPSDGEWISNLRALANGGDPR